MDLKEILEKWLDKDMIFEGQNGHFIQNQCGCVKFMFDELPTEAEIDEYNDYSVALSNLDDAMQYPPKTLPPKEVMDYHQALLTKKGEIQTKMRSFMKEYTKNHKFLKNNVDFDGYNFFVNYWHSPTCSLNR